jgi:hypothetical protein
MLKPVRSIFCLGTRGPVWNAGFSKENRSNHITEERKLEVAFGMEKMSIHRNPVAGYSFHGMKKFTLIPCFFFLSRMPEENYVKKRPNNQKKFAGEHGELLSQLPHGSPSCPPPLPAASIC